MLSKILEAIRNLQKVLMTFHPDKNRAFIVVSAEDSTGNEFAYGGESESVINGTYCGVAYAISHIFHEYPNLIPLVGGYLKMHEEAAQTLQTTVGGKQ